jgi:hypothetical protein
MKKSIVKSLSAAGGLTALVSGYFWYLSANLQVDIAKQLVDSDVVEKLSLFSAQENLWAGSLAAFSGVCIAATLIFD